MESRPNGAATDDAQRAPATPSSLTAAWRAYLDGASKARSTAVLLTLPSGMAVRAKRPTLLKVLASGRIPDTLAAKVEALIAKAQQQGTGAIQDAMDEQRTTDPAGFMSTYLALLDVVWCEAVVEPRFARDPGPGDALTPDTLPVEAVPIGDKTYLFTWAQGWTTTSPRFLTGQHGRLRMWEIDRIASRYGQDPASLLGLDTRAEPWLAWQVRRAVYAFGTWFEAQREATVERPAPKHRPATERVPRYSEEQLRAMLGLGPDGEAESGLGDAYGAATEDLDALASAFLAGVALGPDGMDGMDNYEV